MTPDLHDDMHNGTIADGDAYLMNLVTAVQATSWYKTDGTIIVTFDEDEGEPNPDGYCTDPVIIKAVGPYCIPTFIISSADTGVGTVAIPGDHFGMLRSIEEAYGLPLLNNAANSTFGDIARYLAPREHGSSRGQT